jgi:hypothetical protein
LANLVFGPLLGLSQRIYLSIKQGQVRNCPLRPVYYVYIVILLLENEECQKFIASRFCPRFRML